MTIKHGLSSHPLYAVLAAMKRRCYDKKHIGYKYYGERGVSICDEWRYDIKSFIEWALSNGWHKKLQIDRIDNDKGYFPNNCQFLTASDNGAKKEANRTNTSGYIGVGPVNNPQYIKKRWVARIEYCHKIVYQGYFATKELAAQARNKYIIENKLPHTIQEIINDKNLPSS